MGMISGVHRPIHKLSNLSAGDTEADPPEKLLAIINTIPVWKPVIEALKSLEPGGRLVINATRKESGDKDYLEKLELRTRSLDGERDQISCQCNAY
jgi:hypothetical protein